MRHIRRLAGIGFLTVLIAVLETVPNRPTYAAMIHVEGSKEQTVIRFSGPIEFGDADKFRDIVTGVETATLILDSPGGVVDESLQIGRLVRTEGYATAVLQNTSCASACGFIWLAGSKKTIAGDGLVGFHAAYLSDGQQTVSSTANALVGAYLAKLGYNDLTIIYVTEAAPREMRWLTQGDSSFLGLEVSWEDPAPLPAQPPALTREEIRQALLADDVQKAYMRRFPSAFNLLIDEMYLAQLNGQNWEAVLIGSLFARQEMRDSIQQLYSETSDELIEGASRAELDLLRDLLMSNPSLCAARFVVTEDALDGTAFIEAVKGSTKVKFDTLNAYYRKALLTSPVRVKALSVAERKRLIKYIRAVASNVTGKFTNGERDRLANPKLDRDAELICRYGVRLSEALLRDPSFLVELVRHSREIGLQ